MQETREKEKKKPQKPSNRSRIHRLIYKQKEKEKDGKNKRSLSRYVIDGLFVPPLQARIMAEIRQGGLSSSPSRIIRLDVMPRL